MKHIIYLVPLLLLLLTGCSDKDTSDRAATDKKKYGMNMKGVFGTSEKKDHTIGFWEGDPDDTPSNPYENSPKR